MARRTWLIGIAVAVAVLGGGAGIASATGVIPDREEPITGDALTKASAAALQHVGQGKVTETEVGDEDSRYEVEVTLDDGTTIDVQLDEQFRVVGDKRDVEDGGR